MSVDDKSVIKKVKCVANWGRAELTVGGVYNVVKVQNFVSGDTFYYLEGVEVSFLSSRFEDFSEKEIKPKINARDVVNYLINESHISNDVDTKQLFRNAASRLARLKG